MKVRISHGQAIRSVLGRSRVTHFMPATILLPGAPPLAPGSSTRYAGNELASAEHHHHQESIRAAAPTSADR